MGRRAGGTHLPHQLTASAHTCLRNQVGAWQAFEEQSSAVRGLGAIGLIQRESASGGWFLDIYAWWTRLISGDTQGDQSARQQLRLAYGQFADSLALSCICALSHLDPVSCPTFTDFEAALRTLATRSHGKVLVVRDLSTGTKTCSRPMFARRAFSHRRQASRRTACGRMTASDLRWWPSPSTCGYVTMTRPALGCSKSSPASMERPPSKRAADCRGLL